MNVSIHNKENLEALMQVDIEAKDYEKPVNELLKDYRRRAEIPGFRKGHVPMGLIKKQYGTAILIDEVNKILEKSITKYLEESDFEIIGSPLPKEQNNIDWNEQEDFSFEFEIGLKPDFELELNQKVKIPYFKITADKNYIDKQVDQLRETYGNLEQLKEVAEDTIIRATFTEVDKEGNILEGGLFGEGDLPMKAIRTKKVKKALTGKSLDGTGLINMASDIDDEYSAAQIMKVEGERWEKAGDDYLITIEEINRRKPAELNQELFDSVFGEGKVSSEEEFRQKIKESAEHSLAKESEQKFLYDMQEQLIAQTKMELPENFLKKWLKTENKELTDAKIEEEFDDLVKGFKWQLIEERIIKKNDLTVTKEDLESHVKEIMMNRAVEGGFNPNAEVIESVMQSLLKNEEQVRSLSQNIMEEKIKDKVKELVKLNTKELTFDEFVKKVSK